MRILLVIMILAISVPCYASIEKQQLIDQRIVLQHKIDDITDAIEAIEADEATAEDMIKLEYYKENLEKDNPVPKDYKEKGIIELWEDYY